jgi:hypothetical protein
MPELCPCRRVPLAYRFAPLSTSVPESRRTKLPVIWSGTRLAPTLAEASQYRSVSVGRLQRQRCSDRHCWRLGRSRHLSVANAV